MPQNDQGEDVNLQIKMSELEVRVPGSEATIRVDPLGRCSLSIANAMLRADTIIARGNPQRSIQLKGNVELVMEDRTMRSRSCTIVLGDDGLESLESEGNKSNQ